MPNTEDKKIYNNLVGWANIRLTCVATIYDETISFVSISDINSRQYGYALNFVSWTQNRTFYGIGGTGQTAGIYAEGTLVTIIPDPIFGNNIIVTKDQLAYMAIEPY